TRSMRSGCISRPRHSRCCLPPRLTLASTPREWSFAQSFTITITSAAFFAVAMRNYKEIELRPQVAEIFTRREKTMPIEKHYDVIIIGSGAGGGTLAYALAPTGKSILILERGDYVRREKSNWDSRAVNVEGKYQTKDEWRDKNGKPLHPHTNYYVGGNTKFYGAALFRLRREDFGEIRHFGGISPAWPISYDDLEPYYLKAERLYHVHGKRGEDPTEPFASGPYP